jgi:hypothetical protein
VLSPARAHNQVKIHNKGLVLQYNVVPIIATVKRGASNQPIQNNGPPKVVATAEPNNIVKRGKRHIKNMKKNP